MNIILFAIPFFILLISIEIIVDRYRNTGFYRVNDSISSLNAGLLSRVILLFKKMVPLTIYVMIEQHFALFDLQETIFLWFVAFVLYDFCYYWNHRIGHEINIFWASHVVHHSSEEYNLTTALRQTSGSILGWIFYLPMALLGIEPKIMLSVAALNLVYQFWVHTRHVQKLGWYELIFITPSNHRVHHATNQCYIDRNYGGVFILWDKIFNTYQEEQEDEPCIYGIRKPLKSWNPIWTNLHFYAQLFNDAWHTERWQDKLLIWFKPTGWRPADMERQYPLEKYDPDAFEKFDTQIPIFNTWYSVIQHLTILVGIVVFINYAPNMSNIELLLSGSFIIFSCYSIGNILQGKQWARWLEYGRYFILLYSVFQGNAPESVIIALVALAVFSLVTVSFLRQPLEVAST